MPKPVVKKNPKATSKKVKSKTLPKKKVSVKKSKSGEIPTKKVSVKKVDKVDKAKKGTKVTKVTKVIKTPKTIINLTVNTPKISKSSRTKKPIKKPSTSTKLGQLNAFDEYILNKSLHDLLKNTRGSTSREVAVGTEDDYIRHIVDGTDGENFNGTQVIQNDLQARLDAVRNG